MGSFAGVKVSVEVRRAASSVVVGVPQNSQAFRSTSGLVHRRVAWAYLPSKLGPYPCKSWAASHLRINAGTMAAYDRRIPQGPFQWDSSQLARKEPHKQVAILSCRSNPQKDGASMVNRTQEGAHRNDSPREGTAVAASCKPGSPSDCYRFLFDSVVGLRAGFQFFFRLLSSILWLLLKYSCLSNH